MYFFKFLKSWLLKRPSQEANLLRTLFEKIYFDLYEFVNIFLVPKMAIKEVLYIHQCCNLLNGLLEPGKTDDSSNTILLNS